jgi:hypothetical protein
VVVVVVVVVVVEVIVVVVVVDLNGRILMLVGKRSVLGVGGQAYVGAMYTGLVVGTVVVVVVVVVVVAVVVVVVVVVVDDDSVFGSFVDFFPFLSNPPLSSSFSMSRRSS